MGSGLSNCSSPSSVPNQLGEKRLGLLRDRLALAVQAVELCVCVRVCVCGLLLVAIIKHDARLGAQTPPAPV